MSAFNNTIKSSLEREREGATVLFKSLWESEPRTTILSAKDCVCTFHEDIHKQMVRSIYNFITLWNVSVL